MANSTFLSPTSSNFIADHHNLTPNPYPSDHHQLPNYVIDQSCYSSNWFPGFELSDYLAFEDHHPPISEDSNSSLPASASILQTHDMTSSGSSASASSVDCMSMNKYHIQMKCKKEINRTKTRGEGNIIAFRIQTELETLEDGYKWRKYGKKMVKSNPNPRNYFKCSSMGCKVKKRIERDREDSSYLLTTYEGIHNHQSPCIIYHSDQLPYGLSHGWFLQPSS